MHIEKPDSCKYCSKLIVKMSKRYSVISVKMKNLPHTIVKIVTKTYASFVLYTTIETKISQRIMIPL